MLEISKQQKQQQLEFFWKFPTHSKTNFSLSFEMSKLATVAPSNTTTTTTTATTIPHAVLKSNLGKSSTAAAVAAVAAKKKTVKAKSFFTGDVRKEDWEVYYDDLKSRKATIVCNEPQLDTRGGMFVEYGTTYADQPGDKVFRVQWRCPSAALPFGISKPKEDPSKPEQKNEGFSVSQQISAENKNEDYAAFIVYRESLIKEIVKAKAAEWHESVGRETKVSEWDDRYMKENFNSRLIKGKKNPNTGDPYPDTIRYKLPQYTSKNKENEGEQLWLTCFWDEKAAKLSVSLTEPETQFPKWCHGSVLADANNIWFQKTGISAPITAVQLRRTAPPKSRDGDVCDIGGDVAAPAVPAAPAAKRVHDSDEETDEETAIPDSPITPPANKRAKTGAV